MRRQAVEERFGLDIRTVMVNALNLTGSDNAAMDYIGVSRATWFGWKRRYKVETRRVAIAVAGRKAS